MDSSKSEKSPEYSRRQFLNLSSAVPLAAGISLLGGSSAMAATSPIVGGKDSTLNLNSAQDLKSLGGTLLAQANSLPTGSKPAVALSRYYNTFNVSSLVINGSYVTNSEVRTNYETPTYWYVVVDLTSLKVVANISSTSNDSVPSQIASYENNSQYFLFFIANSQRGYNIPQGSLYTFLKNIGAGQQLDRGEEMIGQLGTGAIRFFSYILAATMDTSDTGGFEIFSYTHPMILTMYFLPVEFNNQTIYAPIIIGSQTS